MNYNTQRCKTVSLVAVNDKLLVISTHRKLTSIYFFLHLSSSCKLIEAGIEPEFSHLAGFVEKRATVANTAFGKLVGARPEGESKAKSRRRSRSDAPACVTTLAIQSTNGKRASDGQSAC